MTHGGLDDLLTRMHEDLTWLTGRGDARRFFHATYLRTTQAVGDEIARGGFADPDWVRRWDLAFAAYYLDALDADRRGDPVSGPWRVAFDAALDRPDLPPLRHVLFGLNAHINDDLPQALLDVIAAADSADGNVLRRREDDHRHVDAVLQARAPNGFVTSPHPGPCCSAWLTGGSAYSCRGVRRSGQPVRSRCRRHAAVQRQAS